jgi:hypothetical protein
MKMKIIESHVWLRIMIGLGVEPTLYMYRTAVNATGDLIKRSAHPVVATAHCAGHRGRP